MVVSFNPSSHLRSSGVCLSFSDHYQNDNMGKMNIEYDLARGPVATHQCTPGAHERNREAHWLPEPQAESGWSYDDENDASVEKFSSQKGDENVINMS